MAFSETGESAGSEAEPAIEVEYKNKKQQQNATRSTNRHKLSDLKIKNFTKTKKFLTSTSETSNVRKIMSNSNSLYASK